MVKRTATRDLSYERWDGVTAVLLGLLILIALWVAIAGYTRVDWVNSGRGMAGWVGAAVLKGEGLSICNGQAVEVKYEGARLHYRCGHPSMWPMYLFPGQHGYSPKLQKLWESLTTHRHPGADFVHLRKRRKG